MLGKDNILNLPAIPPQMLVDCLVERGDFPRRIANRHVDSPQLLLEATIFYFDCIEADNGDGEARERVNQVREKVSQMRGAEEQLGNDPEVGNVRPGRVARVGVPERVPNALPIHVKPPTKKELRKIAARRPTKTIVLPPGYNDN